MKRSLVLGCLAAIAWPTLGRAQPAPDAEPAAHRRNLYVIAGGALLKPISSSRELELADVEGPASLAVQNGPVAGSGAKIDSVTIPAGIIGWVLPFGSRRWSAELVVGLPFTVKFQATGTLANTSIAPTALGIPTGIPPLGPELGEAQAVPLVVTGVYPLIDSGLFRPYLGGGASVLFTRHAKITNALLTEVSQPEMTIAPAPGIVLQGGLDIRLSERFFARLDVKFIALMLARTEVHHINVKTPALPLFESVEVGTAKMNIWVNPVIVQGGLGFDFDL